MKFLKNIFKGVRPADLARPRPLQNPLNSTGSAMEPEPDGAQKPIARSINTDKIQKIKSYEELQPYHGVLTASGAVLSISENQQHSVVLLGLGSNSAFLVATESFFGTAQYMTLLSRAKRVGVIVQEQLITDDANILILIYDKDRKKISSKQEESVSKADSVQFFEKLIEEAIYERATDIHLLIREDTSTRAFRIDGAIRGLKTFPSYMLSEAAGVAYDKLAEETSRSHPAYNIRQMQSCSIELTNVAGRSLKIRYQSVPGVGGHDVTLRLLFTDDANSIPLTTKDLGFEESHQQQLALAERKTVGAIFVAGVTGSGKSTTLMCLMTTSPNRHLRKQYSVEDPVEYKMLGVTQLSVQRTAEASSNSVSASPFIAAMRVIMRADPDQIMVGEVRDAESGSLLKTMVQSGHSVLTSVHTPSAIDIVGRLTSDEIGLPRETVASRNFISALVYQKLLALTCTKCKLPAVGNMDATKLRLIESKFGIPRESISVANPSGCPHCKGYGVHKITVVAEVIVPDNAIRKLIREGSDMEAEELWRSRRTANFTESNCDGKTAFEHALYKMSQGLIAPQTIEDAFEPFETYQVYEIEKAAD